MASDTERISLVVFLGNVGKKYEKTRHNAAWLFASSLGFLSALSFKAGFGGRWAQSPWPPPGLGAACSSSPARRVFFLVPETYMNLSGQSASALASFYKIPAQEILAVHDDIELGFGTVSFKRGGGLGGHNGLRSLKASLASAEFWRLRIGVGRPEHPDVASYVLSPFAKNELEALPAIFAESSSLLYAALGDDPCALLESWAKKKILGP